MAHDLLPSFLLRVWPSFPRALLLVAYLAAIAARIQFLPKGQLWLPERSVAVARFTRQREEPKKEGDWLAESVSCPRRLNYFQRSKQEAFEMRHS